ncbi:solute carrier family 40 member 1-like isoform X2 [Physella acuta]|uniref:solute carrier family 40 member 1-like isoform X2 n=1 Tax=Physella acuta TaxID=109671 RepID=UPI0027DDB4C8|nr:solute carrier family 40 member 1-like isoform X2 [Physella acuta]
MTCCKSCVEWITGTNFYVYLSHFLSSWGDRMWAFGIGLFLINISPESLQLTAIYGLCIGLSILFFGALVGDIVDETPRLKAAQTALVLQNLFVVICAIVVYIFLVYTDSILAYGAWTRYTIYSLIILLCVLSRLTSMARRIAVEKDWVVEMCGKDSDRLATMTASLRRIDLTTQVLAPIATGLIMTYAGVMFGALFIGAWNLVSVFIEYYFLWRVYNTVPALKKKKNLKKSQKVVVEEPEEENVTMKEEKTVSGGNVDGSSVDNVNKENLECPEEDGATALREIEAEKPMMIQDSPVVEVKKTQCKCYRLFNSLERLYRGWPVYARYDVFYAGLALACLYMTVLGFDSITVGYAKMNGVPEAGVGIIMGFAALFGIFGTVMYPIMRRRLQLPRTGIFGLSLQVACLVPCVISVWMPGSKFDLSKSSDLNSTLLENDNCTHDPSSSNETMDCTPHTIDLASNVSIWMLLVGIVTARFGLWVVDLSISQLFMESVAEDERGKVNGVQTSLNQLMDMLKYLMVVLAPFQHQFGLLVMISFCFICLGWMCYAFFLKKSRGHFFHFEKCTQGCVTKAVM